MRRFAAVGAVVLVAGLACAAIAQVPQGPPPGPRPDRPEARRQRQFDPDAMFDRMAQSLGLTAAETAATKKAAAAKRTAAQGLGEELRALGELARKDGVTDKELQTALQHYERSLVAYRQKVSAIDAQLSKGLSLKARAGLTAMGVLENGLGPRFGFGFRRGGPRPEGERPRQGGSM